PPVSESNAPSGTGWCASGGWPRSSPRTSPRAPYVYLEGRIQTRQYTDWDATQRSITEVIASDMRILDAGNGNGDQGEAEEPRDGTLDDVLPV
ncbi:MAG: single-stranded DNA-binding protein, partial [Nitrososphaera sp.]